MGTFGAYNPGQPYGVDAVPADQSWNPARSAAEGLRGAVGMATGGVPLMSFVVVIGVLWLLAERRIKLQAAARASA